VSGVGGGGVGWGDGGSEHTSHSKQQLPISVSIHVWDFTLDYDAHGIAYGAYGYARELLGACDGGCGFNCDKSVPVPNRWRQKRSAINDKNFQILQTCS
jgi:hypothetical protein